MKDENSLRYGALLVPRSYLRGHAAALCQDTHWHTPWIERVLPNVVRIVEAHPAWTIFTSFLPANKRRGRQGHVAALSQKWQNMTVSRFGDEMVELVAEIARFRPAAKISTKRFIRPGSKASSMTCCAAPRSTRSSSAAAKPMLRARTVLGGVDRGYRVVVTTDALCSSSDETHDAMIRFIIGARASRSRR